LAARSRKKGRRSRPPAKLPKQPSRSEQRDAALRATLTPLAPGERPWPIMVGALLAAASGVSQLVLFLAGVRLRTSGLHAAAGQTIAFTVLMLICAFGMWTMRYWAVLGFMALLAILVLFAVAALVKASSASGLVIALAIVGVGGFLFYKLVRVLSRIQMPRYPGR
jgi:uncharacterized membrane protein (DUF2068 family)